jgi:hypothetical protein
MATFKKGQKVSAEAGQAGNAKIDKGVIISCGSGNSCTVSDCLDGRSWTVRKTDLRHRDVEKTIAFVSRFLTPQGRQLMLDGYLDVEIEATEKMREELETFATDSFLAEKEKEEKEVEKK